MSSRWKNKPVCVYRFILHCDSKTEITYIVGTSQQSPWGKWINKHTKWWFVFFLFFLENVKIQKVFCDRYGLGVGVRVEDRICSFVQYKIYYMVNAQENRVPTRIVNQRCVCVRVTNRDYFRNKSSYTVILLEYHI